MTTNKSNISRILSSKNTTTTLLTTNQTYVGTYEDVSTYQSITLSIISDVDSLSNGVVITFATDNLGTNSITKKYTHYGGISTVLNIPILGKYFKITYTNNNNETVGYIHKNVGNQTSFSLNTFFNDIKTDVQSIQLNDEHLDTFNRMITTQPISLLDIKHIYNKNTLNEDEYITGTGTITYSSPNVTLAVTSTNDHVIRQSRLYSQYQPGKMFQVMMTGIINNGSNASTTYSRIGFFDHENGIFFEYSNGTMYIVLRRGASDTTGTSTSDILRISQTNWNIDTLNGNGKSGVTIDFTKILIFFIEFSWLGIEKVTCGIYCGGKKYVANVLNNFSISTPYMSTPNLPMRYEIASTGSSASLLQTCGSIMSYGEYNLLGSLFSQNNFTTDITLPTNNVNGRTESFIMSIRLVSGERRLVKLQNISICSTSSTNIVCRIYLVRNGDYGVTGTYANVNSTHSAVQYNIPSITTSVTTTNWILLYSSIFASNTTITASNFASADSYIFLTAGIYVSSYNSDHIVLTCQSTSTSSETIYATMTWTECN